MWCNMTEQSSEVGDAPGTLYRRARRNHPTVEPIYAVDRGNETTIAQVSAVFAWIAPWSRWDYPGRRRLVQALLPRAVTWGAVQHWYRGRRPLPADIATAWAQHIRSRCRRGNELADWLDDYAAASSGRLKRMTAGAAVVREDGRDRRGNWRR
jgi:hypothetical protein